MGAVYKKELRSSLKGVIGPLFIAIVLAFIGIFTQYYQFTGSSAHFEYAIVGSAFYSLIAVPVLTMRSFSEEKHQKTDTLLYSLPISTAKIVLGKFFAMATVFAIPCAVVSLYPLVLNTFSESGIGFGMIYATVLAYFLLGCAVIAVCMFISSLTESQVIAAVISLLAVLFMNFFISVRNLVSDSAILSLVVLIVISAAIAFLVKYLTKSTVLAGIVGGVLIVAAVVISIVDSSVYEGLTVKIISALCVFEPIENFAYGMFDITAYVYYLSISALFGFLTVQSFERKRFM